MKYIVEIKPIEEEEDRFVSLHWDKVNEIVIAGTVMPTREEARELRYRLRDDIEYIMTVKLKQED